MKKILALVLIITLFIININGVKANELKFSCGYETSYILDFYEDGSVIFYTMAYTYPNFKFDDSFNKNRNDCPQEIYVVEDYTYIVSETQIKNSKKFTLTTPQISDNNNNNNNSPKMRFSCKIGQYYLAYYSDGTAKAENYFYESLDLDSNFNQNPNACPTDLYEKKVDNDSVIISDKPISGFTQVDKTTDENAADDNPYGSDVIPNNNQNNDNNNNNNKEDVGDADNVLLGDAEGMDICSQNGVKNVLHVIGYLLFAVKIAVPLLLVIMGSIDFAQALMANDDKAIKDATAKLVKRVIAGIIVFFIPTILNFGLGLIDGVSDNQTNFTGCSSCLFTPFDGSCTYTKIGE